LGWTHNGAKQFAKQAKTNLALGGYHGGGMRSAPLPTLWNERALQMRSTDSAMEHLRNLNALATR
jgi:hypothetical protein